MRAIKKQDPQLAKEKMKNIFKNDIPILLQQLKIN